MLDMHLFSTLRLPAHVTVPGGVLNSAGVQIDHNELLLRSRKTETFASQMAPPCAVRKLPRCISGREIFLLTPDARASRGPQQQQRFSHLRLSVELRLYLQSVPYLRYRTPPTRYCTGLPKLRKNKTQGTEGN